MTLTLIIPVKNRAHLLPATLDNLLAQTRPAEQILVVDDHSTDDLAAIQARYQPQGVQFIPSQGQGPGAARNTGLLHATGDLIKYFDSDDLCTRNTLQVQVEALQSSGEPLVYSPYVHVRLGEDGTLHQADTVIQYKPVPAWASVNHWMVRDFFTIIPGMMFRKDFLQSLGPWRTDITAYEDWDFLWRIGARVPNPIHTADCCYFYILHGAQTVGAHFDNTARDQQKLICLRNALSRVQQGEVPLSAFDTLLLEAKIAQTLQYLSALPEYAAQARQQATPMNRLLWLYLRLEAKWGRMRTGTAWKPMHGPNPDPALFARYVGMR